MKYRIIAASLAICALLCSTAMAAQQTDSDASVSPPMNYSMSQDTATPSGLPSGHGTYAPGQGQGNYTPGQGTYGPGQAGSAYTQGMYRWGQGLPPYMPPGQQNQSSRQFAGMPAWAQEYTHSYASFYPPFGASLFKGHFVSTYYDGVNSDYVIMPGDRILVHVWGAHNYNDILMVDQQGNIFLPEVGPVKAGGMRNGSLQSRMRQHLSSTFKSNVEIYVNLLTSQPVAVYVTGFVQNPGRYAGGVNDSLLYYLDRAGGIIAERGSYRDITIKRGGKTIANVDLYKFILNGDMPGTALRNGDVIVVGEKGDSVIADGLIPQHAVYENKGGKFLGRDLAHFASPLPAASHVSVTGTRNSEPFHIYTSLRDFENFTLSKGDKVEFLADRPGDNILISVSGSTTGPTRYPVKRHATLRDVLAYIPVDTKLSNLEGVYIKRRSVAEQQRKAIQDSLYRMENALITASSATQEGAAIRVQEAQLLQNFAARVAELEPNGVVVVTRNGLSSDIILEDGDEIVIPQRSDVIQISGEVVLPKAIAYTGKRDLEKYILEAGGFTDRADSKNILVIHPNGEVAQAKDTNIVPGDMLMVMPQYDSKKFTVFKDVFQVIYQVAIATGVFLAL